jgi:hypothetical protein
MSDLGRRVERLEGVTNASTSVCQSPLWNRERPPNATGATSEKCQNRPALKAWARSLRPRWAWAEATAGSPPASV